MSYGIKKIKYRGKDIPVEEIGTFKIDPSQVGRALDDVETLLVDVGGYYYIRTVRHWKMDRAARADVNERMKEWRAYCALPNSKPIYSEKDYKASCEFCARVPVFAFKRLTKTQVLFQQKRDSFAQVVMAVLNSKANI